MGELINIGDRAEGTQTQRQAEQPQAEEPQGELPPANSYVAAVAQALAHKGTSSICRECASAAGWPDWNLCPVPVALPLFEGQTATLVAQLTCMRCGYVRFFSLGFLGVNIEQRRIISPT